MYMTFPKAAWLQTKANSDDYTPTYREQIIRSHNMHVLVRVTHTDNYVVVRGTDSLADWLEINTKIGMEDTPALHGQIHKGFKWATLSLLPDLMLAVDASLPTTFIGHSMGGAVAQLLAAIFVQNRKDVNEVITFGQPKVGDKKFVKWWDSQGIVTHRIVNQQDLVTTLPWRLGKYKHTKQVVYLSNGVRWKVPWYRGLRCLVTLLPKLFKLKPTDHSMVAYRKAVAGRFTWQNRNHDQ